MMYGANPCENWESTPLGKCKIGTNIDQDQQRFDNANYDFISDMLF